MVWSNMEWLNIATIFIVGFAMGYLLCGWRDDKQLKKVCDRLQELRVEPEEKTEETENE